MDTKKLMMMMVQMDNNPSYHNHHHHSHSNHMDISSSEPLMGTSAADEVDQKASLGFMELLGFQDYYSSPCSIFNDTMTFQQLQPPSLSMEMVISTSTADQPLKHDDDNINGDVDDHRHKEEIVDEESSSVVLNGQPTSPNNSSSISSPAAAHQQLLQNPLKQCMKAKDVVKPLIIKKKKKEKEARFAFMTKTEIDHLDDGYRWRKYGQKAVKNSHFPRSYYRCTSASCNVKKRVERCMGDSSYVITTYEGQHNHPVNPPANSAPPIIPSFSRHLITTSSAAKAVMPPGMLKLEQAAGGLLQDMLHCYY